MKRILITLALLLTFASLVHPVGNMDGAQDGVALDNLAVIQPSDKVYYVDAADAQSSRGNGTFELPFSTIDGAINYAVAGSLILVKSTHTETISAAGGIDADKASIIVQGIGGKKPVITLDTLAATDIDIDAANVTFKNLKFVAGYDQLANMIDVNAAGFGLVNCDLIADSSYQPTSFITIDEAGDECTIDGVLIRSKTAGATNGIIISPAADTVSNSADAFTLKNSIIDGDWINAGMYSAATCNNTVIENNIIANDQSGDFAIELTKPTLGFISENKMFGDTAGAILDPGSCYNFENYVVTGSVYSGILDPIVAP